MSVFFWLLVGHAVADFPGQPDFMARAKNHRLPVPGVPWLTVLYMHALIHAGVVAFVTGHVWLGCVELFVHMVIDYGKCDGWFDRAVDIWWDAGLGPSDSQKERAFDIDQSLHIACKVIYAVALAVLP